MKNNFSFVSTTMCLLKIVTRLQKHPSTKERNPLRGFVTCKLWPVIILACMKDEGSSSPSSSCAWMKPVRPRHETTIIHYVSCNKVLLGCRPDTVHFSWNIDCQWLVCRNRGHVARSEAMHSSGWGPPQWSIRLPGHTGLQIKVLWNSACLR